MLEWTGSCCQVPVGRPVRWSVVLIVSPSVVV
jgi:hypothetical protein